MTDSTAKQASESSYLQVKLADTVEELEGAQRLRYEVFVEEMRNLQLRNPEGLERDGYDAYCDHLIVKEQASGKVVGTYRLLTEAHAEQRGGFYSESEFDLRRFVSVYTGLLELGRSCVDRDYRGGRVIQLLWEAILDYADRTGSRYLMGCASIPSSSLEEACDMYSMLHDKQIITDRFGIRPLPSYRMEGLGRVDIAGREREIFRRLPPLMKGYQWLGAQLGGDPAFDPLFSTVDYFVVLEKEAMSRRYLRHFRKS